MNRLENKIGRIFLLRCGLRIGSTCEYNARKDGAQEVTENRSSIKLIEIMLVDNQIMVRTGIRRLLEVIVDFSVIAEVSSGEEALALGREHQPAVC